MKKRYPKAHRVPPPPKKHTAGDVAHEVYETVIGHPMEVIADTAKHAVQAIRTKTPSMEEVREFAKDTVTKLNPLHAKSAGADEPEAKSAPVEQTKGKADGAGSRKPKKAKATA